MSSEYLKIIPAEQGFVPKKETHDAAAKLLQSWTPDGEECHVHLHEHLEFIDQGENLRKVICPSCSENLNLFESEEYDTWWDETMVKADLNPDSTGNPEHESFELDESYQVIMPCCTTMVPFIDLEFLLPAGFARFELSILNPFSESKLSAEQMQELGKVLGCEVTQIWANY